MAKNSDHIAGFEPEDTGGLFSTLLAEEDAADRRRMLWRVATWGSASVAAVVVAVMANQSSLGWKREQAATIDLVQQANRLQALARESQNETRRLASAVETLNSDRDRLYTRVTVLEQGLDSVTGTIAKQNAPAAAAPAAAPPEAAPAVSAPASAPVPAPAVAAVSAKLAAQPEKISAAASAEPASASTPAVKEVLTKLAAMPAAPLVETKSMMAPPDPGAGKLIEPSRPASDVALQSMPVVAATPPGETEQETADAVLPKIQRTEFGVDVGGANSIAGLRALWRGLLKSKSNAPLATLQPIIVIREGTGGRGLQLRLVAGPLGDAAAAAKICAVLTENERDCETAVYDGQRLAMKGDETPAAAKPAAPAPSRKKNAQQRRASIEEPGRPEPAKSSSWGSFFGGKKN